MNDTHLVKHVSHKNCIDSVHLTHIWIY